MNLAELQRILATSLAAGGPPPPGCTAAAVERACRALAAKRRRAAAHLLPRVRRALEREWATCFDCHAAGYAPAGLLLHVDDAWELAERLAADAGARADVRRAARDDLLALRLRFVRYCAETVLRVRERRAPLLGLRRSPPALVLRLPGPRLRVWAVRLPVRRNPF